MIKVLDESFLLVLVPHLLDFLCELHLAAFRLYLREGNSLDSGPFDLKEELGVQEVLFLKLLKALSRAQICEELDQVELDAFLLIFVLCV